MARTALDLIASAMRLVNILGAGEQPDPQESADALISLNDMIDAWNAKRLAIYTTSSNDFPFVLGKQSYTLGTDGDFNMARPAQIDSMSAILLNNPLNPIEVPIQMYTVDEWQTKIPVKNVLSSFPQICYDTGDFPRRTLNFWPIPNIANSVRIYSWQPLSQPAAFNTTIAYPPGYNEAFRYNLAIRLAPEYGKPVSPQVALIAQSSYRTLETINTPELMLNSDLSATEGGQNYRADMFGIPY